MRVVVNRKYGGFGISDEAILKLIEMKSPLIHEQTLKEHFGNKADIEKELNESYSGKKRWVPFKNGFIHDQMTGGYCLIKGKTVYAFNPWGDRKILRTHPDLIKVVEQMGEKSWGWAARLVIVDIPDGIEWDIDDYDGMETVEEAHRSW